MHFIFTCRCQSDWQHLLKGLVYFSVCISGFFIINQGSIGVCIHEQLFCFYANIIFFYYDSLCYNMKSGIVRPPLIFFFYSSWLLNHFFRTVLFPYEPEISPFKIYEEFCWNCNGQCIETIDKYHWTKLNQDQIINLKRPITITPSKIEAIPQTRKKS